MLNNIEGATLLLPDGWTLEGGFVWLPLFFIQANLLVRASDPASGAAVETLPLQQYVWSMQPLPVPMQLGQNWLGSVLLPPPRHPAEFVQGVWMQGPLRHLQGARLDRVEDMPAYAAEFARSQGSGRTVHAARLHYTYQYGGRTWEEEVYLTLVFCPPGGGLMLWYALGHTMRAPAGALARMRPLMAVAVQSLRHTLDWSAALEFVRTLYQQGRRQELADQQRLNQLWIQYREQMRQMHQQVYEERQAAQARQNFTMREILGGIETYVNPFDARTVELPPGYRHCWVSDDGYVIVNDEETFDPRADNRRRWLRMERYRP
jgi:hypothetical protein